MGSPSEQGTTASSFGRSNTTFPPSQFRGQSVLTSPRYRELDRRQAYYDCTQHDGKTYDWDGRLMSLAGPGAMASQPLLNRDVAPYYVPLRARRPSAPYRLPKVITNAFTSMCFGSDRFPSPMVEGDADTQDFDGALVKALRLPVKMIQARNLGGSVGTVLLSWCYDGEGRPQMEVHNGKHLYVHAWRDRLQLVPAHLTEVYLTSRDEWDGIKRKFIRNWYWHRRDWMEDTDILFKEALYVTNQEPAWEPDPINSVIHNDGFCHVSWIQNLPTEEIDGLPDYDGLYEFFDSLDVLLSVISKGAILNLDPTLVLKMDRDIIGAMGIKKGSDNSLVVGEEGDAQYLELSGTSIEAGVKLFNEKRRTALETAECVLLDPTDIGAPDVSSVAMKTKYKPMIAKCDTIREQYGAGMKRIVDQMAEVARVKAGAPIIVFVANPETGEDEPTTTQLTVNLPPRVVKVQQKDETGAPAIDEATQKPIEDVQQVPRLPGQGGELEWEWPDYFPATPDDQSKAITTLSTAAGGKPIVSQQTATEQAARIYNVDPAQEWARVQKDTANDAAVQAQQMKAMGGEDGAPGGKVAGKDDLPGGAKPKFGGSKPPFGPDPDDDKADDGGSDRA